MSHEFERVAHGEFEREVLVRKGAERHRFAAGFGDRRGNDRAVAVIDAARTKRPAGLDQFVAGRQHGDTRPAHDFDRGKAARREHADFARADMRSPAQQRLAARNVGAGIGDELSARHRAAQFDDRRGIVVHEFGVLDHHHGVGAARNDAAGRDGGCGAGHDFDRRRNAAGDHFGIERQALWPAVAGAGSVGGAHGEAVNIGAVERRRIDRRDHVAGQDARQRGRQRHGFAAKRRAIDAGFEAPARLLRRDHFEELLLPCGAAHRVEDCRARSICFGFMAMVSRRLACLQEILRCRQERRSSRRCAPAR